MRLQEGCGHGQKIGYDPDREETLWVRRTGEEGGDARIVKRAQPLLWLSDGEREAVSDKAPGWSLPRN